MVPIAQQLGNAPRICLAYSHHPSADEKKPSLNHQNALQCIAPATARHASALSTDRMTSHLQQAWDILLPAFSAHAASRLAASPQDPTL